MDCLLSIHKRYIDQIKAGTKGYEYRKGAFDQNKVDTVYVYETAPVKKITGKLIIGSIISGSPEEVWAKLDKSKTASSKEEFMDYFKGHSKAFVWEIKGFAPLDKPIDPWKTIPKFWPPMSHSCINYSIE